MSFAPIFLKTLLKRALALLLTAALLVWLLQGQHWRGIGERIAQVPLPHLLLAVAAFAATYLLRAGRVWDEFRELGQLSFAGVLRVTLAHNAAVNILPFRSGEAAFPLLLNRWFGVDITRAVACLLWLRLQDACVVCALAALAWPGLPNWSRLLWILGVVMAALLIQIWARRHAGEFPANSRFAGLLGKLRAALAESTRHGARGWLWTVANWSLKLLAQAWLLAALLGTGLATGLAGALGVELAAILPIQGVAGFGTYEAGGAALMHAHGAGLQAALQAALALHLFVIACALCAGGLALALLPARKASL